MDSADIAKALRCISALIADNKDYLVELDSKAGDGDLGLSMDGGFKAVVAYLEANGAQQDIGRLLAGCGESFNEAAPSSLGTILSIGLIGMARALRGQTECTVEELADAMRAGLASIMEKAGSKPGEKTILDSLCPGVEALAANASQGREAFAAAARAAAEGSEATRGMRSVHGRAAYYGDKSIGLLDGGSVVGKLVFAGIESSV